MHFSHALHRKVNRPSAPTVTYHTDTKDVISLIVQ
jgi:hypothetical protein